MSENSGAFTGGRKPKGFGINRANQGQSQGSFIQPIDRLVEVERYDLESHKIYCFDVKDNRKMIVHINEQQKANDEKYLRENPPATPYTGMRGFSIDKAMEKEQPAGSRLILKYTKVLKKDNGDGYSVVEAGNIRGVTVPDVKKTFYALIGGRLRIDDEGNYCLARASIWNNVTQVGVDYNDDAEVERIAGLIDERNPNSSRMVGEFRETLPIIGVQYRTLLDTGKVDAEGKGVLTAVNFSDLFDWMDGPEDQDGKIIREQSHALTGQEFLDYFTAYVEFVKDNELLKPMLDKLSYEAVIYESAPGSRNKNLLIGKREDPKTKTKALYKLCSTPNYLDKEQTTQLNHDNQVVSGIIQFSDNKLEKVGGKPVEIESFWVNNVHLNGFKGHVHAFIRNSKGLKVEVDSALKLDYGYNNSSVQKSDGYTTEQEDSSQSRVSNSSSSGSNSNASNSGGVRSAQPVQKEEESDDNDPFNFFKNDDEAPEAEVAAAPVEAPRRSRFAKTNDEQK